MVREECQREAELGQGQQESPFSQAVQAEEEQEDPKGPGLLSKMLRQPGILAARTVSLHNLLDQPPAASHPLPPSALVSFFSDIPPPRPPLWTWLEAGMATGIPS